MDNTPIMNSAFHSAMSIAREMHHEYATPEHLLCAFLRQDNFRTALENCDIDDSCMEGLINEYLNNMYTVDDDRIAMTLSSQFSEIIGTSLHRAINAKRNVIKVSDYVVSILDLQESYAAYLLGSNIEGKEEDFISMIDVIYDEDEEEINDVEDGDERQQTNSKKSDWRQLVSNISAAALNHTPLIGREKELDRTIQILCRMEKNNPLHVGDPGVGKTAIIYGLADRINRGLVPQRIKKSTIYAMDISQMLAGAQYRGDFEKRMKTVLDGAARENAILYLDEIHNIMGAGKGGDGGPDASNILKPYLEEGKVLFIGATTHEEYNRRMTKDKGIMRRFQMIDINEPSVDESIDILKGLQPSFQKFHNVVYRKEAIEYAVKASAKYISDRRLPDKAIDLIDEAGAYLEVHPVVSRSRSYVTKAVIEEILIRNLKIKADVLKNNENESIAKLKDNILDKIYGQDKAVETVSEAIMMAKAGLAEDNKPLASLLFVGPTGVGKTEVARVLAKELGVELVRFDMSEYTEKHAVAKLIGSPAGYVGYDNGGLLTDAIRNTPNCVLLLDEIEKAHSDIYNILLQVMDYASLTDNHGQKSDFRNVVLIMTSNAGAQYASQASIGFGGGVSRGEAMMKQVKKTFKPEFINRLNDIVVFNDMDKKMASMILDKKLGELIQKLSSKNIEAGITKEAFGFLLTKGFTKEYGAREMDRVISRDVKPLFMREILFGRLKKGGNVMIDVADNKLCLTKM